MSLKNAIASLIANAALIRTQKSDIKESCEILQEDLIQPALQQAEKVYNGCKKEALACEAKSVELAKARLLMEAEVEAKRVLMLAEAEAKASIIRAQTEIEIQSMKAAAKRAAVAKEAETN